MPCGTKKDKVQKVVIPKGMINPNETTVIEIPAKLQRQPIVIAKKKPAEQFTNMSGPRAHSTRYEDDFYHEMPERGCSQRTTFEADDIWNRSASNPQDLNRTEREERAQLQRDLEEFQRARRKLVASAAHYSAGQDKSKCF